MIEPDADFRYIIQNDLKWCYATNPFAAPVGAAVSTGQGEVYNVPKTTAYTAAYDGYSKSSDGFGVLIDSIEAQSGTTHTHDNTVPADSVETVSGSSTNRPSSPPSLGTTSCFAGNGSSAATVVTYSSSSYNNVHVWRWVASTYSGGSDKITTTTTTDTVTTRTCYNNADGTGGSTTIYEVSRGTSTTQNYTWNVVQDILGNANTATFVTMVNSLQTGNESTYGAGYRDPNEPSSPNLKTDSTFDADVNTMYTQITNANNYHLTAISGTGDGYTNGQAHTYSNTAYNAFILSLIHI